MNCFSVSWKSKADTEWTVSDVRTAVRQNILRTKAVQQIFPWIVLWSSGILRKIPVGKGSDSFLVAAAALSTVPQLGSQCCQEQGPVPAAESVCTTSAILSSPFWVLLLSQLPHILLWCPFIHQFLLFLGRQRKYDWQATFTTSQLLFQYT